GRRDLPVAGVQTCALPISRTRRAPFVFITWSPTIKVASVGTFTTTVAEGAFGRGSWDAVRRGAGGVARAYAVLALRVRARAVLPDRKSVCREKVNQDGACV